MVDPRGEPVLLHPSPAATLLVELAGAAAAAAYDVPGAALDLARSAAPGLPLPGHGRTRDLWEALATLGAADVAVARVIEPHLDAAAILAEAGMADLHGQGTWGVYAAEGPGVRLRARPDAGEQTWVLDGTKPWCSLAGHVSHALVTGWVDQEQRGLFAVDLRQPGVHVVPGGWASRGLPDVPSGPVELHGVTARPVGGPGWYLERDGFAWGGLGVAAVWYGGAVAVARRVASAVRDRPDRRPDQVAEMHLGTLDTALLAARVVLADAADQVDAGTAGGATGTLLALRVRQVVADTVERVLLTADHALGPGPLALEETHARRVADLRLYLRQHHAERDLAALGRTVVDPTAARGGWSW